MKYHEPDESGCLRGEALPSERSQEKSFQDGRRNEILQSSSPKMYCVFMVDIVNSTSTTARMKPDDYPRYYKIFYSAMREISRDFGAAVLKFVGDALIFYFPATSDSGNKLAFAEVINCGSTMFSSRFAVNNMLNQQGLPSISFRISADYGRMDIIETSDPPSIDFVSPSMNMASKMNHLASSNSMVIGGDLRQVLHRLQLDSVDFDLTGELDLGMKQTYPVYRVFIRKPSINKAVSAPSSQSTIESNPKQTLNIILVDDEPDVLYTYEEFLSGQGFNIDPFSDPRKALSRFMEVGPAHYDLAILDIRMDKVNGLQLCKSIRTRNPRIKVLFLTALDAAQEIISLISGVSSRDVLRKPVDRDVLIQTVRSRLK